MPDVVVIATLTPEPGQQDALEQALVAAAA